MKEMIAKINKTKKKKKRLIGTIVPLINEKTKDQRGEVAFLI